MTFYELLLLVDFEDVVDKIIDIYYSDSDDKSSVRFGYMKTLNSLINQHKPEYNDMVIHIDYVPEQTVTYRGESWTDDEYWHVYGVQSGCDDRWALDFGSFEYWLGHEIDESVFCNLSHVEIAAHCLWEMTFISFDSKEIVEKYKEICSSVDEISNTIEI